MPGAIETFTPHDLAKMLNLHPFTVTRLAREGKIPAFKVGGVWRFRKDEFERWIETRGSADRGKSKRVRRARCASSTLGGSAASASRR